MVTENSFPQKNKEVKLPECPICIQVYNLQKKRPYYICRNAHSICKECYREHKLINANAYCPICKCQMNSNFRENSDILTLLEYHDIFLREKRQGYRSSSNMGEIKKINEDIVFQEKFKIPKIIQVSLILTAMCVFPLLFVLISEFSYIVIGIETSIALFAYQVIFNLISIIWRMIQTFVQGMHSTCQTLFIYSIVFHIIYVVHMILIGFSLMFVLKLCAEKVINEQWNVKGKNLKAIQLPKNKIERHSFVVLVNFVDLANKVFQLETHQK